MGGDCRGRGGTGIDRAPFRFETASCAVLPPSSVATQLRAVVVWPKYSNAQRVSSLHLFQRLLESAIVVGYVFQFSRRSRDGLEDHAELVVSKNTNALPSP